ncbi:MAG: SDR family NAD(P)-dependent oxidoreductase [Lachnospiraceae bacterium]|nr:SDR family NAD(P)-dependent oxidoreductase [Lachnospiraceae bacterium]
MKKTALITGASRGIGRSIAKKLARNGYELYLICHNDKAALNDLPGMHFAGDVGDHDFIRSVFSEISHLDVLINNAGISHIGLLQDMSDSEWAKVIRTNLTSAFNTCHEAIPLMLSSGSGRIINISSVWGRVGASTEVAYSASKGGLNAFTMALAKELAPSNIQVNAISCGVIDTDMNSGFTQEEREELVNEIPACRMGTPDDVADFVYSLCEANTYLTGQVIDFAGGWI